MIERSARGGKDAEDATWFTSRQQQQEEPRVSRATDVRQASATQRTRESQGGVAEAGCRWSGPEGVANLE